VARLIGEDIVLRTLPAATAARIKADPGQIEQVLLNLVVNARDAMPEGGELLIETKLATLDADYCARHGDVKPGDYLMLAVSDTGHGMSAEVRERIFEPFYSTKGFGHGTGLGLSTVFGIVQQNAGRIEVYSEPGTGTTFKLYFPLTNARFAERAQPSSLPAEGGGETVLLVEDEEFVRSVAERTLRSLGYHVLVAATGAQALSLVEAHDGRLDLLLTDVIMPGMNGRELATRLLTLRATLKVLYASGFTENVIANHGVLKPGVQFLAKPYTVEALAAKLRETLGR